MSIYIELISPYILTILFAWIGSHTIKFIVNTIKKEKYSLRSHLFMSGGMPSGHSATTVAMATIIGLKEGFDSSIFGLATLFAIIVMYDALQVRRSAGEQGEAIHRMIKYHKIKTINLPKISKGHLPIEVFFGGIFGITIGLVVYLITS
ncbi:MAG: divergent PAP2 family protein [Candidatus Saccharimonadales bacterium]